MRRVSGMGMPPRRPGPSRAFPEAYDLVHLFPKSGPAGVVLAAPRAAVHGPAIPVGKDVFGVAPRALAAVGSGVGAVVIFAGAVASASRFARDRTSSEHARLAGANGLIALGTLILSSG